MTDLRTAAQQALEALEHINKYGFVLADYEGPMEQAITALKAALEQPEQEPVAVCEYCEKERPVTHPPRREWRGLKELEINDGLDQIPNEDVCIWSFRKGVYFAEKALKERNA